MNLQLPDQPVQSLFPILATFPHHHSPSLLFPLAPFSCPTRGRAAGPARPMGGLEERLWCKSWFSSLLSPSFPLFMGRLSMTPWCGDSPTKKQSICEDHCSERKNISPTRACLQMWSVNWKRRKTADFEWLGSFRYSKLRSCTSLCQVPCSSTPNHTGSRLEGYLATAY